MISRFKCDVIGHLAAPAQFIPATKNAQGKDIQARLNFVIVANPYTGEKKTHENVPCTLWGSRAEKLAPFLTVPEAKGKHIAVEGNGHFYTTGHLLEDPKKTTRAFSVNVNTIELGNNSQKNAANGGVMPPEMLAIIEQLAAKNGIDISALKAKTPANAAPAQTAAATSADDGTPATDDTPFGG